MKRKKITQERKERQDERNKEKKRNEDRKERKNDINTRTKRKTYWSKEKVRKENNDINK